MEKKTITVTIFNEQYNGDKMTDFASELRKWWIKKCSSLRKKLMW